jgi:hypothetical protein
MPENAGFPAGRARPVRRLSPFNLEKGIIIRMKAPGPV